jgi:hypothetical protein
MKPRITVLTNRVADLVRSLRFYRDGLGLPTEGITGKEFEYGAVAFFKLHGGLTLAVWPRQSLSRDTGLPVDAVSSPEFMAPHHQSPCISRIPPPDARSAGTLATRSRTAGAPRPI